MMSHAVVFLYVVGGVCVCARVCDTAFTKTTQGPHRDDLHHDPRSWGKGVSPRL